MLSTKWSYLLIPKKKGDEREAMFPVLPACTVLFAETNSSVGAFYENQTFQANSCIDFLGEGKKITCIISTSVRFFFNGFGPNSS